MPSSKWNVKVNGRQFEIKYVRGEVYSSNGLFVNGNKIGVPQHKWYLPFKATYVFELNGKEITFVSWGAESDLILDGMYVNQNRPAQPLRHDFHTWLGHFWGLCCLASIFVFHHSPISIVASVLFALVNEVIAFSPLLFRWKKTAYNVICAVLCWGLAYVLSNGILGGVL